MKKKMWSVLLALCLALSLLPTAALADGETANVAKIGDTEYATLAKAVAAVTNNTATEIMLLRDAAGSGIIVPSGRNITFNFNYHTYTVDKTPLAGSEGTKSQGFQLLKDSTITMKNGTLLCDNGGCTMVVQNYANLTLDGMTLDGRTGLYDAHEAGTTNSVPNYTLSNNCGTVAIKNSTIYAREGHFAFDVYGGFGSYGDVSVTVSNSTINGKIEVARGNSNSNKNTLTINAGTTVNGAIKVTKHANTTVTINGGSFTDLATAVKYAAENATISLASDVTVNCPTGLTSGQSAININKNLTINGNGKTITAGDDFTMNSNNTRGEYHMFNIENSANVTLKNLTINGDSKVRSGINLYSAGTVTVSNVTVSNCTTYGLTNGSSTAIVNGLTTSGNGWGGINVDNNASGKNPSLTISACNLGENNSVYFENRKNGTVTGSITGGTFKAVNADSTVAKGSVSVTGGTFSADPSAYVPADYNICVNNGTYTVVLNSGLGAGTYLRQPAVSSECVWNESGGVYNVYVFTAPAPSNPVAPSTPSTPTQPTEPSEPSDPADEPSVPTSYPDVAPTDWYAPAVAFVTEEGLMSGTENGFEPNSTATRAMLWTILARLDGKDGSVEGGEWFTAAQLWSISAGISDGSDPHGTITREQLAVMLYRYAISLGLDVSVGANTNILSYGDAASVSDFAVEAMQWACGAGIINGVDGNLDPQGNATRAQLATMLMRYVALFD